MCNILQKSFFKISHNMQKLLVHSILVAIHTVNLVGSPEVVLLALHHFVAETALLIVPTVAAPMQTDFGRNMANLAGVGKKSVAVVRLVITY